MINSAPTDQAEEAIRICVPAAKKGVIGVAVDEWVSLPVSFDLHDVASQFQNDLPRRPGNFFPRRDMVVDGAKTRWIRGSRGR